MRRIRRDPMLSIFLPSKVTNFLKFRNSRLWNTRKMAKKRRVQNITHTNKDSLASCHHHYPR